MADIFSPLLRCYRDAVFVLLIATTTWAFVSAANQRTSYSLLPPQIDSQVNVSCRNDYSATSGEITSPNYPGLYPANALCESVISVPRGSTVWLQFTTVEMEQSYNCQSDSIKVYKRDSLTSSGNTLVSTLCGFNSSIPSITINGSDVYIVFQSDAIGNANGFHAMYNIFPSTELEHKERGTYTICEDTMAMSLSGAILSHPGYPSRYYPNDVQCEIIIAPAGGKYTGVYVTIYDVSLKVFAGDVCSSPSERIVVGAIPASTDSTVRAFCQNQETRTSFSAESSVAVTFYTTTHDAYNYRGFKIIFTQYYPASRDVNNPPCLVGDFYCGGLSRCIPDFLQCDGVDHCGNYADERNCKPGFRIPSPEHICNPDEYYCGEYASDIATCISTTRICDGTVHCFNGTDEFDCSKEPEAGLSARAMLGVVIGLLQIVIAAAVITRWVHSRRLKKNRNKVLRNTSCTEEELERL